MAQRGARESVDQQTPFSRGDIRRAGLSEEVLQQNRFSRVWWNTYVERGTRVTPVVRARAALRDAPGGTRISHHTAAELWGAAPPAEVNTHVTLPSANGRLVRRGVQSHYGGGSASTMRSGIPVSTPEQTFVELASVGVELVDLVVVGDGLVKAGHTTPDDLVRFCSERSGRGCRLARRAAGLVREDVDSVMETRLRLLIVLAGLPEPDVNLQLRAEDGSWRRRYDLAYPDLKIVVEYDGRQHLRDTGQWNVDILRREELARRGWLLITVTAEGIWDVPAQTLGRVREAVRMRSTARLRKTYRSEWTLHFPGRPGA